MDAMEISRLASHIGLGELDFIERHTRLRQDRLGLALIERPDHSCIFLEGDHCAVQAVKPQQCMDFPGRWVNALWGRVSMETIQGEYPMLYHCEAFKTFLKNQTPS